jgi:uncharacterized SAM-binding protein YcdF (DUF218 family)
VTPLTIAKMIGGPGSLGFLAAGTIAGVVLLRFIPRAQTFARAWLALLCAAYLVMALPPVAQAIAAPLADEQPVGSGFSRTIRPVGSGFGEPVGSGFSRTMRTALDTGIDTLVVFDGDNRRGRVQAATRLWHAAHPATVIASGEPWLEEHLREAGIPADHLVLEQVSRTTRDQVDYVRTYAADHPDTRIAVIASQLQVPRVAGLFRHAWLRVSLLGASVDKEVVNDGVWRYVPAYAALRISRDALYERIALVYYEWRGWIDRG